MTVYASKHLINESSDKVMDGQSLSIEEISAVALPQTLDGSEGSNRARGVVRQTAADTDVKAIRLWLAEYVGSSQKTEFKVR